MKVELKEGIFIEGSSNVEYFYGLEAWVNHYGSGVIYQGKTSEIPEELASQCCKYQNSYEGEPFYKKYGDVIWTIYPYKTAKESIQSACQNEYCIIYKTR